MYGGININISIKEINTRAADKELKMVASASLFGTVGACFDSKGGGRDGRRRRTTEIDGKLWKIECLNDGHFDIFAHALIVKERNKDGKRCYMTTIDEEKVCISWPLDGVDERDISGTKQVSEHRIDDGSVLRDVDPGRMRDGAMHVTLNVLFEQG